MFQAAHYELVASALAVKAGARLTRRCRLAA
jgi:hypothetical protein